jgi:hypothetical protein
VKVFLSVNNDGENLHNHLYPNLYTKFSYMKLKEEELNENSIEQINISNSQKPEI